jgi:hypothetical protein
MAKKGLIRPNVDTQPIEPAAPVTNDNEVKAAIETAPESETKSTRSSKKFKNQGSQIKMSDGLKEEFNALKQIRKIKFDYDMLGLLIDHYTKDLTPTEKRKFKTLTED